MNKRTLGKTGWTVSEIGYGAWGIGKLWWGKTDDNESIEALKKAWDQGINFYDTAYVYGDGHSEQILVKALGDKNPIIATKIPPKNEQWPGNPRTPVQQVFPADWIFSCTERSLKYLQRETIDLTQFHVWRDEWLEHDDWKEAVLRLKKQGKIKAFGISINDHDPNSALKMVESGLIDSVQVIFNIFDQSPATKLLPLCQERDVGVIVRVPLDEGGLSGSFTKETTFEEGDFRRQYFNRKNLEETVDRVEKLRQFIGDGTKTMAELALKFILGHAAVSTVIPGMRKVRHVEMNARVSESEPLSERVMEALKGHAWNRNFYTQWED